MSTTETPQKRQFCCHCYEITTDYFTNRETIQVCGEPVRKSWHFCMKHGEIAIGQDWLAAQSAGRHTFTVSVLREYAADDGEPGYTESWEPDTIWLSLERAIRRYEALTARGEQVDLIHDYRMNGEYLYADGLVSA